MRAWLSLRVASHCWLLSLPAPANPFSKGAGMLCVCGGAYTCILSLLTLGRSAVGSVVDAVAHGRLPIPALCGGGGAAPLLRRTLSIVLAPRPHAAPPICFRHPTPTTLLVFVILSRFSLSPCSRHSLRLCRPSSELREFSTSRADSLYVFEDHGAAGESACPYSRFTVIPNEHRSAAARI